MNTLSSRQDTQSCEPAEPLDTLTDRLNILLNSSGSAFVLSLCPDTIYPITQPIYFNAPNQEISTLGYPEDDSRAMIVVNGPVNYTDSTGHTTAIDGSCSACGGVTLRNVQINGTRLGNPILSGGANIEMGYSNAGQVIQNVRSFDPRGWSCLHISEGNLSCTGTSVLNNDIGPCGSDQFQQWADGISLSCRNSVVRGNTINTATDGGIVVFGSPGSLVENNTIWVETATMLGGINMVDYNPFSGDYRGTIVRNNTIVGAFATSSPTDSDDSLGTNNDTAFIKIGIAIGPRTWFGDEYGERVNTGGTVIDNSFTGGFGYAIALSSARNFTVENNGLFGNTSFFGSRGPNCSTDDTLPTPAAFVFDQKYIYKTTVQMQFQSIADGDSLTCIVPPRGDYWPYGGYKGGPISGANDDAPEGVETIGARTRPSNKQIAGLTVGSAVAFALIVGMVLFFRHRLRRRIALKRLPFTSPREKATMGWYMRTE